MKHRGKLAELRNDRHQSPGKSHLSLKFIFILALLAIISPSTVAQENKTDFLMNEAEVLMRNGSTYEALSAYYEALETDPENTAILVRMAFVLNAVGKANESSKSYLRALDLLDRDLQNDSDNCRGLAD